MYKRIMLIIGLLVFSVFLLVGCSTTGTPNPPNEQKASLGQEFTLPVGQTATISGENLSIKFVTVTNDSRCPTGAQCIVAGAAKCQMAFIQNGNTTLLNLTELGGTSGNTQKVFDGYQVNFQLLPYPEVGKQPAAVDYKLLMKITKS